MTYSVLLTKDAASDLHSIYDYIYDHDTPERADYVINEIEKVLAKLSTLPERGVHPRELIALGVTVFREVHFKPYRIIYRIRGKKVYIVLIADARRQLQTILLQRLLDYSER